MNIKTMKNCLITFAGIALLTASVRAATVTAVNGDLILGFRATGGTGADVNLEVNLGSISNFYYATPGTSFNLPQLAIQDIVDTYGANWFDRLDLYWGAAATWSTSVTVDGFPRNTMWVTDTDGDLPLRRNSSQQNTAASQIINLDNGLNGKTSTLNSDYAAVVQANEPNSWSTRLGTSGMSFNYFDPIIDGVVGTIRTLYLAQLVPTTSGTAPGELVGTFTLSESGLQFQAVPEPSTGLLVALGLGISMLIQHRRKNRWVTTA